ncbi:hypothetical protein JOD25_003284 [Kurthia huakuii]|nr:hypothetical protein [Kurthia huakuii]
MTLLDYMILFFLFNFLFNITYSVSWESTNGKKYFFGYNVKNEKTLIKLIKAFKKIFYN